MKIMIFSSILVLLSFLSCSIFKRFEYDTSDSKISRSRHKNCFDHNFYLYDYKYDSTIYLSGVNDSLYLKVLSGENEIITGLVGLKKQLDSAISCNPNDSESIKSIRLLSKAKVKSDTTIIKLLENQPLFIYQPIEKYIAHNLSDGKAIVFNLTKRKMIDKIIIRFYKTGINFQNRFSGTLEAFFISLEDDTIWHDFLGYVD